MSNSSTIVRRLVPESSQKKSKVLKTIIVLGLNFILVFFTAWYLKEHQKSNRTSSTSIQAVSHLNQKVSQMESDSEESYVSELQVDLDTLFKE